MTLFNRNARLGTVLVGAGLILSAACSSETPPPAASTPAAPAPAPAAPPGPKLYVSDETGGAVVVIDATSGQVIDRIAVGKRPRGIRISRDGTTLLVALSGSPIAGPGVDESKLPPADRAADGIGVVDLATRKVVRTLTSGQDPEAFDLSPDGKTLYVSNEETAEMSVIDMTAGTITARVKVGEEPEGVTVRPDGREVYVTCEAENEVVAVDTTTLKVVGRMKTGARPAVRRLHQGRSDGIRDRREFRNRHRPRYREARGRVVDRRSRRRRRARQRHGRWALCSLPMASRCTCRSAGRARLRSSTSPAARVTRTIEDVGDRPWGIEVSADGTKVYTANGPSADVAFVDLPTGTVERRIATGGSPWGVAIR